MKSRTPRATIGAPSGDRLLVIDFSDVIVRVRMYESSLYYRETVTPRSGDCFLVEHEMFENCELPLP